MTLDRHPEFNNLVEITASNLNILPGLVLKDYWVTRILRTIATDSELSKNIIFKGGTSLSKGWQLIDRFSEGRILTLDVIVNAMVSKIFRAHFLKHITFEHLTCPSSSWTTRKTLNSIVI